mgnify:CR=1 FL=1
MAGYFEDEQPVRALDQRSLNDVCAEIEALRKTVLRATTRLQHKPSILRIAVGVAFGMVLFGVIMFAASIAFTLFIGQQAQAELERRALERLKTQPAMTSPQTGN